MTPTLCRQPIGSLTEYFGNRCTYMENQPLEGPDHGLSAKGPTAITTCPGKTYPLELIQQIGQRELVVRFSNSSAPVVTFARESRPSGRAVEYVERREPMTLAYLPSPTHTVWHLGSLAVRASALIALAAIVIATRLTARRWTTRGGRREDVIDIAIRAGAFTLVGGRLAQILSHPLRYFGGGASPLRAAYVWDGRIGFWGAMLLGALGTWVGCRRKGIALTDFADALAPGLVLALGIGCWGNYFDQTSYGRPTDMAWAIGIDPAHRPAAAANTAFYQPTFLFESVCDMCIAALLIWIDRRWHPRHGRLFAIYMVCFTLTREAVGALDTDAANRIAGAGLDDWVALLAFLGALIFLWSSRRRAAPGDGASETADGGLPAGRARNDAA